MARASSPTALNPPGPPPLHRSSSVFADALSDDGSECSAVSASSSFFVDCSDADAATNTDAAATAAAAAAAAAEAMEAEAAAELAQQRERLEQEMAAGVARAAVDAEAVAARQERLEEARRDARGMSYHTP